MAVTKPPTPAMLKGLAWIATCSHVPPQIGRFKVGDAPVAITVKRLHQAGLIAADETPGVLTKYSLTDAGRAVLNADGA